MENADLHNHMVGPMERDKRNSPIEDPGDPDIAVQVVAMESEAAGAICYWNGAPYSPGGYVCTNCKGNPGHVICTRYECQPNGKWKQWGTCGNG